MQGDAGAALGAIDLFDGVLAEALGVPAHASLFAGLAALDGDPVGDHEARVEAHTELPDQARQVFLGLVLGFGELCGEGLGAGARDGAQVRGDLFGVHADAVVRDGQGVSVVIHLEGDLEALIASEQLGVGQPLNAQLVAGV